MKNSHPPSIDGFIPRRPASPNRRVTSHGLQPSEDHGLSRPTQDSRASNTPPVITPQKGHGLTRSEIEESLSQIDEEAHQDKPRKRKLFRDRKKLIKRVLIVLALLLLAVGIYVGIRVLIASGGVFKGDLFGLVQSAPLKTDANGRSNILIFGTSEDSRAHTATGEGPLLTDSMMVVSIDQDKKDAYMVSVPRDMYVDFGTACLGGYSGRINEVYQCFSDFGKDEEAGTEALRKKAGEVVGMDVQYTAQVNYTVVEDLVDAVGGISVVIDSDDPRGIYDPNFDWMCGYRCNLVKYPNGPTGNIDGEHALALARARNATSAGYGIYDNFDREQYQQKIIKALREKAVSAGTLTNLGKVTSMIDALGDNLRTNFETKEIRTLMGLAADIPSDKIVSIDLSQATPAVYTGKQLGGASLLTPTSGDFNYTSIIQYIRQQVSSDPVVRENAKLGVYNGSGVAGAAQTTADKLTDKNFTVSDIGNAVVGEYPAITIYDMTSAKPKSKQRLESMYGVKATTEQPPVNVIGLDFVILVGKAPAE